MSEEIKKEPTAELLTWRCHSGAVSYNPQNLFHLQITETGYELWIGEMKKEIRKLSYAPQEEYVVFTPSYGDKKITYNRNEKKVVAENCDPVEIFNKSSLSRDSLGPAFDFLLLVVGETNPYVYRILTCSEYRMSLARKNATSGLSPSFIMGLLRNITNLGVIEKIAASSSYDVLVESLQRETFTVSDGKKLRQSVQLPVAALKWAKTQQYGSLIPVLQEICNGDDTVATKLVDYLKSVKTRISSYSRWNLERYLNILNQLREEGFAPLRVVNYLASQNFIYSTKMGLPVSEAGELLDTVHMAKANGCKFEFASNLSMQHTAMRINCNILANPRAEEFKAAVAKYSVLEFENTEYSLIVPADEKALFDEGSILHHCVASYRDLIIDEGRIVLFLRKKDDLNTPYITVEVDEELNILQLKEKYDQDVEDANIYKFIGQWKMAKGYLLARGGKIGA